MEAVSLLKSQLRKEVKSLSADVEISLKDFFEIYPDRADRLGVFKPLKDEPKLKDFKKSQMLCWPKLVNTEACEMAFYKANEFSKSSLGFLEPDGDLKRVKLNDMDLIFVPGQAFDCRGARLGRGKGFYDRYLKDFEGVVVGVCSSERFLNQPIPLSEHDVSMDWIVTEKTIYKVNRKVEEVRK